MKNGNGDSPNAAALFEAANKLRGSVESAEYKHLVLGLLFLKYISNSFALRRAELEAELRDPGSDGYVEDPEQIAEVLEDRDEYVSENVFWVPADARWEKLLAAASQPDIAKRIDDALALIARAHAPGSVGSSPALQIAYGFALPAAASSRIQAGGVAGMVRAYAVRGVICVVSRAGAQCPAPAHPPWSLQGLGFRCQLHSAQRPWLSTPRSQAGQSSQGCSGRSG